MTKITQSPFHQGEQKIQTMLGVRARMERFGQQVIRNFMPDQHRDFYHQLPFIMIGHADENGWPWASILFNDTGFISSVDNQHLRINALPVNGDPLAASLGNNLRLGLLGIELETRRRNRLSGCISHHDQAGIELLIDQAFGNCPQYIQTRKLEQHEQHHLTKPSIQTINQLDHEAIKLIENSDTFFVASYVANNKQANNEGVDVSHRGGKPGFIRVDNNSSLTIPDYLGNFHFNTLGNFIENPKAGLLFIDFDQGHLLTLTGTVEILWDSPDTQFFAGAERLWTFKLAQGRWLKHALPLRWKLDEYSINTQLTGSWQQASALAKAEAKRDQWHRYRIIKIDQESSTVKSFWLTPEQGLKPTFKAGQFLTVSATIANKTINRTYTISSAPTDDFFRISVKHETSPLPDQFDGLFSSYLHQQIAVGDSLNIKAPAGAFTLNTDTTRPAVLISAGIGITPMIAMAHQVLTEGIRTRSIRPLILISAAHNVSQRPFFNELNELSANAGGAIQCYWILSQIDDTLEPHVDYHLQGRISQAFLASVLPNQDADFFLCGPSAFMQNVYDSLQTLGINDGHIFAEAFGPSSLQHNQKQISEAHSLPVAKAALIKFTQTQIEQVWTPDQGSLLQFSETHGIEAAYGCRSGQCGACKANLLAGQVHYLYPPQAPLAKDEILLCCSVPAQAGNEETITLTLDL